jgi:hypothetical protein
MKPAPLLLGVLIGLVIPLLVLAPAFFLGPLVAVLEGGRVYFLLPALALLLIPGVFAGQLAAHYAPDRRAAWRFSSGLFFGASLAAALLLWRGSSDVDVLQRLVIAAFGGPILAGFWLWLGSVLGLSIGYGRRERTGTGPANP